MRHPACEAEAEGVFDWVAWRFFKPSSRAAVMDHHGFRSDELAEAEVLLP